MKNSYLIHDLIRICPQSGQVLEEQARVRTLEELAEQSANLISPRNAYVCFQLIVRLGGGTVPKILIEADAVTGEQDEIAAREFDFYAEWFHCVKDRYYPDALVPLGEGESEALSLTAVTKRNAIPEQAYAAVWVDLFVPANIRAGDYRGAVRVRIGDATDTHEFRLKALETAVPNESLVIADQWNARLRFFEPGYTDFFKFLNKVNGEGLFDPESLVQTPEQFATKCNQGRVLAIFGGGGDCNSTLEKNNMADRSYVWFDIVAPGKTKYEVKPTGEANRGGEMWLSITKNAKDPVRIIQFYDDMFKLENQILVGWGFEGKYYKVENGKRVVTDWLVDQYKTHPDTFWEDVGLGYARQMSTNYGAGFTLSDGDFAMWQFSESWISKTTSPVVVETLSKYGAKTQADLLVKSIERDYGSTAGKGTDEMKKFNTEAIAEYGKTLPKFILEKDASKLDGIWQGLEKTLKEKGLDKYNQASTEIYQAASKEIKK